MRDFAGAAAARLTSASFPPQAIRAIRTNDARAIALAMNLMFTSGVGLWFADGVAPGSTPIIAANAVAFLLAAGILTQNVRHTFRSCRKRSP